MSGKITFPDGEPMTSGTIVFSKPGFVSRSFVGADGTYNLGSVKENDGIPPGTYKVFIIHALVPANPNDPSSDAMKSLIDEKYTSLETTPLEITIPGKKVFDITVERPSTK